MKTRRLVLHALLLALPSARALARDQKGPQRNLLVELRWVESRLNAATVAAVREGAVLVGTGGSVTPRGSVSLSTPGRSDKPADIQRVRVLNGFSASLTLGETTSTRWLDFALDLPLAEAAADTKKAPHTPLSALARTTVVETSRSMTVTPHWPGNGQAVRVEFATQDQTLSERGDATQATARVLSTVLVPMDEWTVVARSQHRVESKAGGMLSSRDADADLARELQLRVSLAP